MKLSSTIRMIGFVFVLVFLSSCSNIPLLSPSVTPSPSVTLPPSVTPSPTATSPVEVFKNSLVVREHFDEIYVSSTDDFHSSATSTGWGLGAGTISNGVLAVEGKNWNGLIRQSKLNEGMGVQIEFKYEERSVFFTAIENNEWDTNEYRKFGVFIDNLGPNIGPVLELWAGSDGLGGERLNGNLKLKPGSNYSLIIAILPGGDFFEAIWDQSDPAKYVSYREYMGEDWSDLEWSFIIGADKGYIEFDNYIEFKFGSTTIPTITPTPTPTLTPTPTPIPVSEELYLYCYNGGNNFLSYNVYSSTITEISSIYGYPFMDLSDSHERYDAFNFLAQGMEPEFFKKLIYDKSWHSARQFSFGVEAVSLDGNAATFFTRDWDDDYFTLYWASIDQPEINEIGRIYYEGGGLEAQIFIRQDFRRSHNFQGFNEESSASQQFPPGTYIFDVSAGTYQFLTEEIGDESKISPNGKMIFISKEYAESMIFDLQSGEELIRFPGYYRFEWSPDSQRFFMQMQTWEEDSFILGDSNTFELQEIAHFHDLANEGIYFNHQEFSPDGKWILYEAIIDEIYSWYAYNIETTEVVKFGNLNIPKEEVNLSFYQKNIWSPDGKWFLTHVHMGRSVPYFVCNVDEFYCSNYIYSPFGKKCDELYSTFWKY